MATDYSFEFVRVIPAGAAEAVPVVTDPVVWDTRNGEQMQLNVPLCGMTLVAVGGAMDYEVGIWNATDQISPAWIVIATGSLLAGTPDTITFNFSGARTYIRKTSVSAGDITLYASQTVSGPDTVTVASPIGTTTTNGALETTQLLVNGHAATIDTSTAALNGKLPAAAAAADNIANPTTTGMLAYLMGWTGAVWARLKTDVTAAVTSFVGYPNVLPTGKYNLVLPTLTDGQGLIFQQDANGALRTTLHSYEASSGGNKSIELAPLNNQYNAQNLIDTTNVAAGTAYYPGASGLPMDGYKSICFQGTAGGGVTTTIQATLDSTLTDWYDITPAGYNPITNAYGAASFIDTNFILDYSDLNVVAVRIVSVTSDNTNNVQYDVRQVAI